MFLVYWVYRNSTTRVTKDPLRRNSFIRVSKDSHVCAETPQPEFLKIPSTETFSGVSEIPVRRNSFRGVFRGSHACAGTPVVDLIITVIYNARLPKDIIYNKQTKLNKQMSFESRLKTSYRGCIANVER